MGHNEDLYDVIIVGGGPAGLSAAIYVAGARYRILECEGAPYHCREVPGAGRGAGHGSQSQEAGL